MRAENRVRSSTPILAAILAAWRSMISEKSGFRMRPTRIPPRRRPLLDGIAASNCTRKSRPGVSRRDDAQLALLFSQPAEPPLHAVDHGVRAPMLGHAVQVERAAHPAADQDSCASRPGGRARYPLRATYAPGW